MLSTKQMVRGTDGILGGTEDGEDEYGRGKLGLLYCFSKMLTGWVFLVDSGFNKKNGLSLLDGLGWCWTGWAFGPCVVIRLGPVLLGLGSCL